MRDARSASDCSSDRASRCRRRRCPTPSRDPGQLLLKVKACAVCRTDLHLRDHEIEATKLPVILGHQIVGITEDGRRVGVPWLGWTDGTCQYCTSGRENLCVNAQFTGRDIDGGYAELTVADERFCLPLPDGFPDEQLAPLLCGGLIGYRALTLTGDAAAPRPVRVRLGRPPDLPGRRLPGRARVRLHPPRRRRRRRSSRGASAPRGRAAATRPRRSELDAAIIFASAGPLVPQALSVLAPDGRRRLRRDPHERHPVVPVRAALQGAQDPLGRQPDPRATATSSSRLPRRSRSARRSPRTSSTGPSRRSPTSEPALRGYRP